MTCDDVRPLLSAYHDGELGLTESRAIEQHLETCAGCSEALAELSSLSGLINGVRLSPPDSLRQSVRPRPRISWNPWPVVAFAGMLAAFYVGRLTLPASPGFADDLIASHTRSLQGNHLIDVVSSDRHTVKPWFIGKIDYSPTPYDLKDKGFELKGGRLDYVGGQTVPVYVYGYQKHVVNLYVFNSNRTVDTGGLNGYHFNEWKHEGMTYIAVSDVADSTLTSFHEAFDQAEKG